jgi:hypothetical protein
MKIAVVGAGIFGCVTAVKMAEAGHKVSLFERNKSVMSCASSINQYRLHRGYHYPRSKETVEYVKESSLLFEEEFPTSICREGYDRYYAIPHEGSLVSPEQYLSFLDENSLEYELVDTVNVLQKDKIALTIKVKEFGFDVKELYLCICSKMAKAGVLLKTNQSFTYDMVGNYDVVINATYASLNEVLPEDKRAPYQYELCEKPVVRLSDSFTGKSVVVVDGEFCCVDPIGFNKDYQVIGHVKEAIHDRSVGLKYDIPVGYEEVLNRGILFSKQSRFDKIMTGFSQYFNVSDVTYKGSMYTVRTVLPNHDHDDARPSNIIKHSDNLYSLFSGKIGTCVDLANKLVKQI